MDMVHLNLHLNARQYLFGSPCALMTNARGTVPGTLRAFVIILCNGETVLASVRDKCNCIAENGECKVYFFRNKSCTSVSYTAVNNVL